MHFAAVLAFHCKQNRTNYFRVKVFRKTLDPQKFPILQYTDNVTTCEDNIQTPFVTHKQTQKQYVNLQINVFS